MNDINKEQKVINNEQQIKILIVEDERIIAKDIQYRLKRLGYGVSGIVSSGNKAIKEAKNTHPDLVLMDIWLKGNMDGIEAANNIRDQIDIPVIYLTAYADDKTLQRAKVTEPYGYLIKPFVENDLHTTIEMALYKHKIGKKLKQSEEMYKKLVETSPDAVSVIDLNGQITVASVQTLALLGFKNANDIIGRNALKFIAPEDRRDALIDYKKIMQSGLTGNMEYTLIREDGTRLAGELNIALIKDDRGKANSIIAIIRDITERKRTEEKLATNLHYFQSINEISEVIEQTVELDEMLEETLKRILKIFKCDRAWLLNPCDPEAQSYSIPYEFTVPEYPGAFGHYTELPINNFAKKLFKKVLATKDPVIFAFELEGLKKVEQVFQKFTIRSQMVIALKPKEGKPWMFGLHQCSHAREWTQEEKILFKDIAFRITDALSQKLLLQNLKTSEEKYRNLVEKMNDGLVVSDANEIINIINPRICEIMGCSDESDLIGHSFLEFLDKKNQSILKEAIKRRKLGISERYELVIKRLDGKNAVLGISASPIFDDKNRFIGSTGVWTDLTEKKEKEKLEAALYAISDAANTVKTLPLLYEAIRKIINELIPVKNFFIALSRPEEDTIAFPYYVDEFMPIEKIHSIKTGKTLHEYVLMKGRSFLLTGDDIQQLNKKKRIDFHGKLPVQWLGVPLKEISESSGEKVTVGIIVIHTHTEKITLTTQHQRILEFVSTEIIQAINRKQADEAIREAKEYTQNLINSSLDMIISVDKNRKIVEFNRAAEETFGYTKEEILGKHIDILYADLSEGLKVHIESREKGRFINEITNIRKNGEQFPTLLSASILLDEKGEYMGVMGVSRDITKRKHAEEALRDHLNQTRDLRETVEKLNRSDSLETIYSGAIGGILSLLKADQVSILLYDPDGILRIKAYKGLSSDYRKAVEEYSYREKHDIQFEPVCLPNIAESDYPDKLRDIILNDGIQSCAFFPVAGENKILGKFTVYYNQTRNLTSEEIHIGKVLAENLYSALARIQTQKTLIESEEKYRSIVEHSLVGIAIHQDGKIKFVNPSAVRILGYNSRDEIIGKSALEIVHPDYRELVKERVGKMLKKKGEIAGLVEEKFMRKNGSYVDVNTIAQSILYEDKLAIQVTSLDITERKRAENALQISLRRIEAINKIGVLASQSLDLEEVLGHILDGTLEATDATVGMIFIKNLETGCLTLGASKGLSDKYISDYKDQLIQPGEGLMGRISETGETIYIREDSSHDPRVDRDVVVNENLNTGIGVPIIADDEVVAVMGVMSRPPDILGEEIVTLTKAIGAYVGSVIRNARSFAELQRLSTAIEQAAESILISDTDGTIQYINPAFEQTTGYSFQEVAGKNPRILKSGKQEGKFYQHMWDTITQGKVWTGRFINKKKDGSFFEQEATISPIRDSSGQITSYVSVSRDITQEVALEEQLRQAQKLEAVGQLTGGIAHDFNNIITGIMGFAELSKGYIVADHPINEYLNTIIKKSDEAATLIRQMLAFSRKQILDIKPMNLNTIVLESTTFLQRVIGENINLNTNLEKRLKNTNADSTAIQQIITNLCINARDAMPDGGNLEIWTENIILEEEHILSYTKLLPGNYVRLSVIDTGNGMDPEIQKHIFEPFFTTKDKGSGLGLSTVYGLVKQQKGFIECKSKSSRGTTFEINFPSTSLESEKYSQYFPEYIEGGRETILVVEDDADVLNSLKAMLENCGYTILTAVDGLEALNIYKENKEPINLVVTDVIMPQMGGVELFETINKDNPEMKFLFITGYAGTNIKDKLTLSKKSTQMFDLLQKPFISQELALKVRIMLDL